MGIQLLLDEDVFKALIERSIEGSSEKKLLLAVTHSGDLQRYNIDLNDLLRGLLGLKSKLINPIDNYPRSKNIEIQRLLDGLRQTIFHISSDGLIRKNKKWVATPNVVTITVQDAVAKNLRITVYGKPNEFNKIKGILKIEPDMAGYSRFLIGNSEQLPTAIKVIEKSYELKKTRGRI